MAPGYELDEIGWQILQVLQTDPRVSFQKLGDKIGLTGAAVAERVRRMEEAGIIKGYWTEMNFEKLGLPIAAFIKITVGGENFAKLQELVREMPEVLESHYVVGGGSLILKVALPSLPALEELTQRLLQYGTLSTSLILSSSFQNPTLKRPPFGQ